MNEISLNRKKKKGTAASSDQKRQLRISHTNTDK